MNYGVYKSANYGTTWNQTPLNDLNIISLAGNGNEVYAGTDLLGMWRSSNYGIDWTQSPLNTFPVFVLRALQLMLFAGTDHGVYQSTNSGTTWTQRNEGLSGNSEVQCIKILSDRVLAGVINNFDVPSYGIYKRPLEQLIGIQPISNHVPNQFSLSQNYPNPFNPTTHLGFRIASFGLVKLVIYDILGTEIETLVDEQLNPGTYEVKWNGGNYPSGVYFYRLTAEGNSETKKMMLVK
jgi:hypothetical protein